MLTINSERQLDHVIAISDGDSSYTWSVLRKEVAQAASALLAVQSAGTLIIEMTNSAEALINVMSAFHAGWNVCPIAADTPPLLRQQLYETLQPHLIISAAATCKITHYSQAQWHQHYYHARPQWKPNAGSHFIGMTSGTTATPKLLYRTATSWAASCRALAHAYRNETVKNVIIPGKLAHGHFLMGAIDALHRGMSVSLMKHYDTNQLRQLISDVNASLVYVVPTMIQQLIEQPTMAKSLLLCGGDHCLPLWQERAKTALPNMRLWRYYGSMETSFISLARETDTPTAVGFPLLGVTLNLTETGVIEVTSDQLFSGYSSGTTQEKQWQTSDYGQLSENGELTLVGRVANRIQFGALSVQAEVIEAVLQQADQLEKVAVIGRKDVYWGEVIIAYYTGNVKKTVLRALCRQYLKAHERPRHFIQVAHLPLTATGKINRKQLREEDGV